MGTDGTPRSGGLARNIFHMGLGQVATTVLSILLTATMARLLGAADFGRLYLVVAIASFAYVVVDWGHGPYLIREIARKPDRAGDLLGSSMVVRAAAAVVVCVASVAITALLGHDLSTQVLTGVLIIGWLPLVLGVSFGWVFRATERMDLDAMLNVALKFLTLVLSVACLMLGGRLMALVIAWSAAGCLTLGIAALMYRRLGFPRLSVSKPTARALLRDGVSFMALSLAVAAEPYFNANILYKLGTPEVVGWYGAASNIVGTLLAPATILGTAMYPRWSKAAGDPAEFKRALTVSFRPLLLLAVLGAVGTYAFADVAIGLIYSMQRFGPAADTLRAGAPVIALMYWGIFLSNAVLAAGKAGRLASAKIASVAITAGLVFVLIPVCQSRFGNGGLGIMYAMAIGESLMLVSAGLLIRKAIDAGMILQLGRSLLAGAGTIYLMRLLSGTTPVLTIPLCIVVFGALAWLVGAVNRTDIDDLVSAVRKPTPGSR